MANAKKDALERLSVAVAAAKAKADEDPLWGNSLDELEGLVATHPIGTNRAGWKNPYPIDDPRSLLFEYQFRFFHDRSRFKLGLQARQTGKDFTVQGEAAEDCLGNQKAEWMVAGPSERQAMDSLDKAKDWAEAFDLKIHDYDERREGTSETLLKSAEITWSNGSKIRAVPGKPDTVRGRSASVILTEFDFFEDPDATWRAILPSITNKLRGGEKKIRLVTTPNGAGSATHRMIEKAAKATQEGRKKTPWSIHKVTLFHAVLMGLEVDVAELREAFDDEEGFLQEYLCEFLDGASTLLPYDLISLAESADASEACNLDDLKNSVFPIYCGIDFGRQNDPTVCWTAQDFGVSLVTREVLVLDQVATPEQEEILRSRIEIARRTSFDYTGPGIGLGDYLVKRFGEWKPDGHSFGRVELCTFTPRLKQSIFPNLRRAMEAPTRLRIPVSRAIREDFHDVRQVISNGVYSYVSPRTVKGHSDRATAAALCVRAAGSNASIPFASTRVPRRSLLSRIGGLLPRR